MKEFQIIKKFFKPDKIPLDDCFNLRNEYIITTDSLCEGTHFLHTWSSPADLAIKSLEVNISDIAAGGGIPKYAFLNLGLSKVSGNLRWLQSFSKTFGSILQKYSIELCGGDTYRSKITNITITLLGIPQNPKNRREGEIGDSLYITGNIGLSAIGYKSLKRKWQTNQKILKNATKKHLRPASRLELSYRLFQNYSIHACMDITDGLLQDSQKLSNASQLLLEINVEKLPLMHKYLEFITLDEILSSGEELELLFLSKDNIPEMIEEIPISKIGQAKKGKGIKLFYDGKILQPSTIGFEHF
ncbi:MAG: thiamine-phosphate kinase [Leptospiraceae bacterium]|nr:thiamine-phosphate kinase [Leptospiraceae bacterium]